jgi:ATP-dependent DNA helicase RecG
MRIVWFGQPFISKTLKTGDDVFFSGKIKNDIFGMQMVNPMYEKAGRGDTVHTARIVPMYPLTRGITQKQIRFLVRQALEAVQEIEEWVPESVLEEADLVPLADAIRGIHFPEDETDLAQAEHRLKFDELFLLQLRAELLRQSIRASAAPSIPVHKEKMKSFVDGLPFELTEAQRIAAWEILRDMEKAQPMNRMLEGDVGAGKTVVAGMALLNGIVGGHQAVMMAPTEILARQHFKSLTKLFGGDVSVGLLTGSEARASGFLFQKKAKSAQKKELIEQVKKGKLQVLVGTHAVLSDEILFEDLGLVIVDEQHRFGVEQRKNIRKKSGNVKTMPHFLSMTATPIPRSFALTLYGDLDLSVINEMPKDRKPVKTQMVDPHNRSKAYGFIREQVKKGRQVFVICPLIDSEHGASEKKSVLSEYAKLSEDIFPDLKVACLHGKMKAKEKEGVMALFAAGDVDVLVSTSVVEVGVDIPNASVMMIEGAERFGLAQLHQFRGRVGRSGHQSYCFLFTDSDSKDVAERLHFFEKNNNGFAVAEYDLERRGPGEVYGTSQSGMMQLRFATMRDVELIRLARSAAKEIDFIAFPQLKEKVQEWERAIHLE